MAVPAKRTRARARNEEGKGVSERKSRAIREFEFCLVNDPPSLSVQPHINIGSCFQAEVPSLQDRSQLEEEENKATLVWKPWGDIATNPDTQTRVTDLLNTVPSSAMPGGGTNLELALHCLHEAQGDTMEAMEMLMSGPPQRAASHPLANYHYSGSDMWTPMEEQLFQKAFSVHKKDFFMIQKEVQTKTVAQCVEYYYTWKKKIRFTGGRARGRRIKVEREQQEAEEARQKAGHSPRKRRGRPPKEKAEIKREAPQNAPGDITGHTLGHAPDHVGFPFGDCSRLETAQGKPSTSSATLSVFHEIRGHNADVKSHSPPEQVEPPAKIPRCCVQ